MSEIAPAVRKVASSIEADTETILEQWGRWASQSPLRTLMYPHMEPYRRLYSLSGDQMRLGVFLSDELLECCDRGLARLIVRDRDVGETTALYYSTGCNLLKIERETHINRRRCGVLVRAGRAWMDCFLYGAEEHF